MTTTEEPEERSGLLRPRDERDHEVTSVELFFDLVFVFAVTQLSHLLLGHLSVVGAIQTLLLLLAIWWAWVDTAWVTNWFDPNHPIVRMMLMAVMLVSLVMSAALPEAFDARGLIFAVAYVVIQVGRALFAVVALDHDPMLRQNFQRILVWTLVSGLFWLVGGLTSDLTRELLWLCAVAVDVLGPVMAFQVPGLGHSEVRDWTITGGHLAERFQLFVIVALGESVLVTGTTLGEAAVSPGSVTAFVLAFIGSVAFWWIYFDRSARYGSQMIKGARDPGRLGRSAYTYFHLPMVAGIIVMAVADEVVIAHPDGPESLAAAFVTVAGPILFLGGHALFKHAVSGWVLTSHLAGIAALGLLLPVGMFASPLVVGAVATAIVVAVAVWDARLAASLNLEER
jgi:low temperature requirement protein LtrA